MVGLENGLERKKIMYISCMFLKERKYVCFI